MNRTHIADAKVHILAQTPYSIVHLKQQFNNRLFQHHTCVADINRFRPNHTAPGSVRLFFPSCSVTNRIEKALLG